MKQGGKFKWGSFFAYLAVVLVVIAVFGLIAYYTNGFTDDFKSFYVECDGRQILSTANGYEIGPNAPLNVSVNYTFGAVKKDIGGYSVKVIPNADEANGFDFTADGQVYSFAAENDLTKGFDIESRADSFTIKPKGGITDILQAVYPDKIIEDCAEKSYRDMYALIVTSYNGKASVKICFTVTESFTRVTLDRDTIVF